MEHWPKGLSKFLEENGAKSLNDLVKKSSATLAADKRFPDSPPKPYSKTNTTPQRSLPLELPPISVKPRLPYKLDDDEIPD